MKTRDFKGPSARKKRTGKPVSAGAGLLAGLLIGLLVAFLVYLEGRGGAAPTLREQTARATRSEGVLATALEPSTAPARSVDHAVREPLPLPPPQKRFEFYEVLPEMEVRVPEEEIPARPAPPAPPAPPQVTQSEAYLLQVGAFQKRQGADGLRAELLLQGFSANVQPVTIRDRPWFRVHLGPFEGLERANEVRSRLNERNVKSVLVQLEG